MAFYNNCQVFHSLWAWEGFEDQTSEQAFWKYLRLQKSSFIIEQVSLKLVCQERFLLNHLLMKFAMTWVYLFYLEHHHLYQSLSKIHLWLSCLGQLNTRFRTLFKLDVHFNTFSFLHHKYLQDISSNLRFSFLVNAWFL